MLLQSRGHEELCIIQGQWRGSGSTSTSSWPCLASTLPVTRLALHLLLVALGTRADIYFELRTSWCQTTLLLPATTSTLLSCKSLPLWHLRGAARADQALKPSPADMSSSADNVPTAGKPPASPAGLSLSQLHLQNDVVVAARIHWC